MKKTQAGILVIDDKEDILFAAKMVLKKHFEQIHTLADPKQALRHLSENRVDVLLMDMNYRIGFEDGREGIYLLKEIKAFSPNTVVILMTAFGKVETAVEGLKLGAFDYILKPWDNDKLVATVKQAVAESRRERKQEQAKPKDTVFIGESPAIKRAYSLAEKVAGTDANVLILGENGTGKSAMARHIHQKSQRASQPFIHIDLGSLNDNIFESELFGYARGAFTDAKADTPGRFELADKGTIFLDEIGNVPLYLQSKLLQVIQNKQVTRLGEAKARPVDVRIITATNASLKALTASREFREDLYYRINTMEILLPPLRERRDDLTALAHFFLNAMAEKYDRENLSFVPEALTQIERHAWNGNIREMENRIERAVILSDNGIITLADLDLDEIIETEATHDTHLSDMEKTAIERALQKHCNNISKTAEELGLSRAALYRRMDKYEMNKSK